jgi:hypothetical protein
VTRLDVGIIAAFACAAALWWLVVCGGAPQARVLCTDPVRGRLSADMDMGNVTQTPEGWVLYFPRRDPERQVEVWRECEVHQ